MGMRRFILMLLLLLPELCFSQFDSLKIHIKAFGTGGTTGFAPHWIAADRYGLFSDTTNDALIMPGFEMPMRFGKHFKINTGFDFAINHDLKKSFIYQGYLNAYYGKLQLKMGRQEYTIGQHSDTLSSGSFIISNNALPVPMIGLGFYNYVEVPFTHGYVYIKGAWNQGWLDNNRLEHSLYNKPFYHEKYLYVKFARLPVNPFIGLVHTVMYGGVDKDGKKVGVDYWAAFFGKGSTAAGRRGEATNAIGEHLGIIDIGLTKTIKSTNITAFYQIPMSSSTGYIDNFSRNGDFFTGLLIKISGKKIISGFDYEWIRTWEQGGEGIPDPIVNGKFIVPSDPNDRQYLKDYYTALGYNVSDFNTEQEWRAFLEAYTNYGLLFGGRENYYNNHLYGHIYKSRIIGTPLFLTKPELRHMAGNSNGYYVINNRVEAHHFGFFGWFTKNLNYRMLFTFTRNQGAWQQYGGRTTWEGIAIDPDFNWYWKGDRDQYYTLFEIHYSPPKFKHWNIQAAMAWDFGRIYHNLGGMVGIEYNMSELFNPTSK